MKDEKLHIGFFSEFKSSDPTVVMWASAAGLRRLAAFLRDLHSASGKKVVLSDQPWVTPVQGIRVEVEDVTPAKGMQRSGGDSTAFRWSISATDAAQFADLVQSLVQSPGPGHHYLECGALDGYVVLVSKGEYDGLQDSLD